MTPDTTQLTAIGIIFLFFIKEFFAYLRTRKNGNGNYAYELKEIKTTLNNHMTDYNTELKTMREEIRDIKTDIEIMKDNINDIKIKIK